MHIYLIDISLSDVLIALLNKFTVLLFKTCLYVDGIALALFSLTAAACLGLLTDKKYSQIKLQCLRKV